MLNPKPRSANVADAPRAKSSGVEMAQWLLTMLRMTGAWYVEANTSAAWKSDSDVAPSPIHADAMAVPLRNADAIAQPTACTYCVARLPEMREEAVLLRRVHHRQLPALQRVEFVRQHLVHHLHHRVAGRDEQALLAVGGEVHVARPQRALLRTGDGLLAQALHVERDLALPMGAQQAGVEAADQHHVAQAGAQLLGRQVGHPRADGLAVVVEHADQLLAHQGDALDLLVELGLAHLAGRAEVAAHPLGRVGAAHGLGDAQAEHLGSVALHAGNLPVRGTPVKGAAHICPTVLSDPLSNGADEPPSLRERAVI